MAEHDYVRLAGACHCGQPLKLWAGVGRKPLYCADHSAVRKERRQSSCEGCGILFHASKSGQRFCSKACGRRTRLGYALPVLRCLACAHCGNRFESSDAKAKFCSKRCKVNAWWRANPQKVKPAPRRVSAYCAKICPGCGSSNCTLCGPCAKRRERRNQAGSNVQRAKRAGVHYRYFSERKVLERDGWTCQLCGISTPREARGSLRPDAPEFDHCLPIALGGPHIPENGQCLCRACNGQKADKWCDRSIARAVRRGLVLDGGANRTAQEPQIRQVTARAGAFKIAPQAGASPV